jgi:tetratricopeptide (TPR) repeat protein
MEPTADQRLKAALVRAIDNHRAGKLDLAEALYGEILGAHPDHPQTLYLLGVLSLQRGAFGKAAGLLQKVIDLKPDHAEAKFSLGRAFGALGRPGEAEAMFRACLALAPDHADARLSLGTVQQARGAYGDAEASFHRVLEIDPKSYRALANLGSLCMLFGRGSEGEAYLARAAALRPDDPQLLCNLAASYKGQGRLALALETYDRVLDAEPVNVEALAGKANVLEKMGEDQAALDLTLPLVEAGSTNANVALIFAALASGAGRSEQALALLQRILNRQTTGTEQRCKLLFAEARLLEQAGEYDRAFQAVSTANDLVPRSFDVAGHDRRIDRIIETYGAETFPKLPRAGNESKLPVFIVGMPRSGKSLRRRAPWPPGPAWRTATWNGSASSTARPWTRSPRPIWPSCTSGAARRSGSPTPCPTITCCSGSSPSSFPRPGSSTACAIRWIPVWRASSRTSGTPTPRPPTWSTWAPITGPTGGSWTTGTRSWTCRS